MTGAFGPLPAPPFTHLQALSTNVGVFEHALLATPRPEDGYCTDDVARALAVVSREPDRAAVLEELAFTCLAFLERAQLDDGRFHNRLSADPETGWTDDVGSDDANGHALFGLGVAVNSGNGELARRALACFERGAPAFSSTSPRSNGQAVLGAAEVAGTHYPGHPAATALFERASGHLGRLTGRPDWPWPEARLAYDNARLAEARIAGGLAFGDADLVREGLVLLTWLVEVEQRGDHFSFTPAGGWAPGEPRPGFDQQPVEAGAMADACGRAFDATGDARWAELGALAARWFLGRNDTGVELFDRSTGGCCDGLEREGRNENQGAESTLALISALQQARRLQAAVRNAASSSPVETNAAPTQRSAAP